MRRSSAREGQTEPLAALVAVVAVGAALSLYAGAVETSIPDQADPGPRPTADRIERGLTVGGVVHPDRLPVAVERAPDGYRVNVTLAVDNRTERAGPPAPDTTAAVSRRVSVRLGGGRVDPGRLEVRVWR